MAEPKILAVQCDAPVGALRLHVQFRLATQWTVLFGPSGSGKTSLLHLIAGLWTPRDASVQLGEVDLTGTPSHQRRIGLVAQQPALFPHLDVLGNVRFGCSGPECAAQVGEMLELFDLQGLQHARIARLSGGERQRVALARTLAASPRLLLLDEVFTGMHRAQRDVLLGRVRDYCVRRDVPILSVTHDVAEALACATEVVTIDEGRVVSQGLPQEVLAAERRALLEHLDAI